MNVNEKSLVGEGIDQYACPQTGLVLVFDFWFFCVFHLYQLV